jgi:hypothetical protein
VTSCSPQQEERGRGPYFFSDGSLQEQAVWAEATELEPVLISAAAGK